MALHANNIGLVTRSNSTSGIVAANTATTWTPVANKPRSMLVWFICARGNAVAPGTIAATGWTAGPTITTGTAASDARIACFYKLPNAVGASTTAGAITWTSTSANASGAGTYYEVADADMETSNAFNAASTKAAASATTIDFGAPSSVIGNICYIGAVGSNSGSVAWTFVNAASNTWSGFTRAGGGAGAAALVTAFKYNQAASGTSDFPTWTTSTTSTLHAGVWIGIRPEWMGRANPMSAMKGGNFPLAPQ